MDLVYVAVNENKDKLLLEDAEFILLVFLISTQGNNTHSYYGHETIAKKLLWPYDPVSKQCKKAYRAAQGLKEMGYITVSRLGLGVNRYDTLPLQNALKRASKAQKEKTRAKVAPLAPQKVEPKTIAPPVPEDKPPPEKLKMPPINEVPSLTDAELRNRMRNFDELYPPQKYIDYHRTLYLDALMTQAKGVPT
jgi:hypothetical protein